MKLNYSFKSIITTIAIIISFALGLLLLVFIYAFITAVSPATYSRDWHQTKSKVEDLVEKKDLVRAKVEAEGLVALSSTKYEKAHGLLVLADVNLRLRDNVAAAKNYQESLDILPGQRGPAEILVTLYLNQGEYQKANIIAVDLAENNNPPSAENYHLAGETFQYLNNKGMAEYYFKKAADFK